MQQALVDARVNEARTEARTTRNTAADIEQFLATLPPLKLQNITLSGPIRPPDSGYEVVMPAFRGAQLTPSVGLKAVKLARDTQLNVARRRGTFGRGELKLV